MSKQELDKIMEQYHEPIEEDFGLGTGVEKVMLALGLPLGYMTMIMTLCSIVPHL